MYALALALVCGQSPALSSMSPVEGGAQLVFSVADPTHYSIETRSTSVAGGRFLVVIVRASAVGPLPPPGPGPVDPSPNPGPAPPNPPPAPRPTRFGAAEKATQWAVEFKLPATQRQAVAKNYRAMVAAIAAGSIKAADVTSTLQRQNQEVLGDSYAEWLPWRGKVNAEVAALAKAGKFDMAKLADFAGLYAELADGLEAVK